MSISKDKLNEYKFSEAELSTLAANNTTLNYWMIKPKDFDPSKK